ncbi:MAG: hypothetical protein ACRDFQ_01560, partial [Anaerolineales bacterium]
MLDDFLREDDPNTFLDEVEEHPKLDLGTEPETGFLGMTAGQRFVISLLFFFMVVVMSAFCLLITRSV